MEEVKIRPIRIHDALDENDEENFTGDKALHDVAEPLSGTTHEAEDHLNLPVESKKEIHINTPKRIEALQKARDVRKRNLLEKQETDRLYRKQKLESQELLISTMQSLKSYLEKQSNPSFIPAMQVPLGNEARTFSEDLPVQEKNEVSADIMKPVSFPSSFTKTHKKNPIYF